MPLAIKGSYFSEIRQNADYGHIYSQNPILQDPHKQLRTMYVIRGCIVCSPI